MNNMEKVDLDNDNNTLVGADGAEVEVNEKENLMFDPHPNTIFAGRVEKKKLASGLYLPDGYGEDDNPTPIAKVLSIGENVKKQFAETDFSLEKGDFIYVDANYMRFAQIDGVKGLILMADGILGKVRQPNE